MKPVKQRIELIFFKRPEIGEIVDCGWCSGSHAVRSVGGLLIIECLERVGIISVLQQRDVE